MIEKWFAVVAITSKLLVVPDFAFPAVVIVTPVDALVSVTSPVQVPLAKAPVFVGVIGPADAARVLDHV